MKDAGRLRPIPVGLVDERVDQERTRAIHETAVMRSAFGPMPTLWREREHTGDRHASGG